MAPLVHRKRLPGNPSYAAWESSGLRWLGEAADAGGARVVALLDVAEDHLDLERLVPAPASPAAAEDFGRRLATTHDAGAPAYGCGPPGWEGDGWLGPSDRLLPLEVTAEPSWGSFYARARILAVLRMGRDQGTFGASDVVVFERVARRLAAGEHDDPTDRPSRLHGDLWAGNVMWTAEGAVLIDPAAHGGHRETDLAMLSLFGAPGLERILAAYDEAHPLAPGWPDRVGLHQLHPLMLHAVLFGGSYVAQAVETARRYA